MFAKDREAMRLTPAEVRLILIESLQWCANNAVYFLGLIGAATYDLAGTAFLVAAITLVRNLMTSVGNMVSGSVIDRFGPRRTSFVTCVITAVLSLGVGLAPLSVPGLVFAACVLGLAGGFINTCTHAFPGYLESTTEGRTRVNGLMVFYSNIAYTAGPLLGGAIAIPMTAALLVQLVISKTATMTGDKVWHVACTLFVGAVGLGLSPFAQSLPVALALVCLSAIGIHAAMGVWWTIPTTFLTGPAAAGSVALINSCGNLGGWVGPNMMAWVKVNTGSFDAGYFIMGAAMLVSGLLVLTIQYKLNGQRKDVFAADKAAVSVEEAEA